jgi:uncharacterized protein (DUF2252 family)
MPPPATPPAYAQQSVLMFAVLLCLSILLYSALAPASGPSLALVEGLRGATVHVSNLSAQSKLPCPVCLGYCLPRLNTRETSMRQFDCNERPPINRLRVGLQLDNCPPAVQSADNAQQVAVKLEKLADNDVFVFFRGTAALFLVDLMCSDPLFAQKKKSMPRVTSNGDAHPANFGTQVLVNGGLVWGVNDFDQSFDTPFAWDVKRGATGVSLACTSQGWNQMVCHAAVDAFISAYIRLANATNEPLTGQDRYLEGSRASMAAPVINDLFLRARKAESDPEVLKWLQEGFSVDTVKDRFVQSAFITPVPDSEVPDFQAALDAYLYNGVAALMIYPAGEFWHVLAAASVVGAGTGSIGLNRFYLLLRGKKSTYGGRIILEMKQEVHSIMESMFRYKNSESVQGKRAVDAERGAYPYANPFYGWTNFRGHAYIVREKSKHEESVQLDKLTAQRYMDYSHHSGRALAMYHFKIRCPDHFCRLDDPVAADYEVWNEVAEYIREFGPAAFLGLTTSWANGEAERQIAQWTMLRSFVYAMRSKGLSPLELLDSKTPPLQSDGDDEGGASGDC